MFLQCVNLLISLIINSLESYNLEITCYITVYSAVIIRAFFQFISIEQETDHVEKPITLFATPL